MGKLFLEVFNLSIMASYLIAVVIIARLLLKKTPRSVICALWVLVGIRLVCPFTIESVFSLLPSRTVVEERLFAHETDNTDISFYKQNPTLFTGGNALPAAEGAPAAGNSRKFTLSDAVNMASYIWLAGIGVMLAYLAVSWRRIQKCVRMAVPMNYDAVKYYQCDGIASPFLFGIVNPKIYVPSGIAQQELPYVLRHENAHKHRRDYIIKPIGYLLLTFYWFNPLIWAAYILLCRDIELACDERVISSMGTAFKKEYSQALLSCSISHRTIAACPVAFGEIGVKNRVKNVLNYKKPTFWVILAAAAACVVITVCFATGPKEGQNINTEHADTALDGAAVEEYVTIDASKVFPLYIPVKLAESLSFETPSDYELFIQSADKQCEIGRMCAMPAGEIVSAMEEGEYYTIGDYGDNGRLKDLYSMLDAMQVSNVPEEHPVEGGGTLLIPNADASWHPEQLPNAGDEFRADIVKGKDLHTDIEKNTEKDYTITGTDYGYIFIPADKTAWAPERAEELEALQNALITLLPTVKVHVLNVVQEAEVFAENIDEADLEEKAALIEEAIHSAEVQIARLRKEIEAYQAAYTDEDTDEARQIYELQTAQLNSQLAELELQKASLELQRAELQNQFDMLHTVGSEADTANPLYYDYVKQWAEAFCDRDGNTIVRLAGERAEQSLVDRELLDSGVDEEGKPYASFGWSSPWPWGSDFDWSSPWADGENGLKNYRIVSITDKTAVILYYAWVSDPHVTVWREVLAFEIKNGEFSVTSEELSVRDAICTAAEFYQAYPDGTVHNTMMDYAQGNGAGEALNQNALLSSSLNYRQLFEPDTAAVDLLNILNNPNKVKTTVDQSDGTGEAVVTFEFLEDGSTASVTMIQPYGEHGIWAPR